MLIEILNLFLCLGLLLSDVADSSGNQFVNQQQRQFYLQKIFQFRRENEDIAPGGVVFIGNSIVEAFDLEQYFPGVYAVNRGITGDRIGLGNDGGILKRMEESCYALKPSKVFLMIGINDLGDRRRTVEELGEGYRKIVIGILDSFPDIQIYVQSILPTGGVYARLNPAIDSLNDILVDLCESLYVERYQVNYVDLHSQFSDDQGQIKRELTIEGLHLKNDAYQLWADYIFHHVYSGQCYQMPINFNDSIENLGNEDKQGN